MLGNGVRNGVMQKKSLGRTALGAEGKDEICAVGV